MIKGRSLYSPSQLMNETNYELLTPIKFTKFTPAEGPEQIKSVGNETNLVEVCMVMLI